LLDRLRAQFTELPTATALRKALEILFRELAPMGVLNALLTEGRCLYAFSTKPLFYIERRAPFGRATLIDEDLQVDFLQVTTPDDRVAVLASAPLTRDEEWSTLPLQQLSIFCDGALVRR
jgi:predicted glutamine amidotransferase